MIHLRNKRISMHSLGLIFAAANVTLAVSQRVFQMALAIPELTPPMGSVNACASGVRLSEHPSLDENIGEERSEIIARLDNGNYLRLLRERFDDGKCHFHLDLYAKEFIQDAQVNSTLVEITEIFDTALLGKTLPINFHSRFRLEVSNTTRLGAIPMIVNMGINLNGIAGQLSSDKLQLADSVYREIVWQRSKQQPGAPARFEIELRGKLGPTSVSQDLFAIAISRATEGFQKFFLAPAMQIPQKPAPVVPK